MMDQVIATGTDDSTITRNEKPRQLLVVPLPPGFKLTVLSDRCSLLGTLSVLVSDFGNCVWPQRRTCFGVPFTIQRFALGEG